jgi:hypothetical protein
MNDPVAGWLKGLGFFFDPFAYLESASDPHLLRYIIVSRDLAPVWEDVSALVEAPVGGGKTALRLYAFWNSIRGLFSFFPINYVLPREWGALPSSDIQTHGEALARVTANAVILLLAAFPHAFLALEKDDQKKLAGWLAQMSGDLPLLSGIWHGDEWPQLISMLTEPALAGSFAKPRTRDFMAVGEILDNASPSSISEPLTLTNNVFDFLLQKFRYQSIHLLVDGLDGFPATDRDPIRGAEWLREWLVDATQVFPAAVRVKAFITPELNPYAFNRNGWWPPDMSKTCLEWRGSMLVPMLRYRLQVASNELYGSMDALCSDEIKGLDERLVDFLRKNSRLLPRELLVLARAIITAHVQCDPQSLYITEGDIQKGFQKYQALDSHLIVSQMAV